MTLGAISPLSRTAAIEAMRSEPLDLLVVGAGATGCGTALDAASRGLSVGIIEKGDIAGGTSSRSSSLVHGGLRYLKQGDVSLVREALRERDLLLTRVAPHLVRPLAFTLPLRHRLWERVYLGAGLMVYDLLGGSRALPRHRHLSRRAVRSRFPALKDDVIGGIAYFDAHMDDARMALAVARTAVAHGAHLATRARLVAHSIVDGLHVVTVADDLTGLEFEISARAVALCTGSWTADLACALVPEIKPVGVVRSKGVHLRLPRSAIDGETALIVASGKSVLLLLPASDHWIVGTTDTAWTGSTDSPVVTEEDVAYLLDAISHVLARPVGVDEVTFSFAGLRPLAAAGSDAANTTRIGREHRIERLAPGLLAIVGGKWTTYRVMGRDMVDEIVQELGGPSLACTTDAIQLIGAWDGVSQALPVGVPARVANVLLGRYGGVAGEVAQLMEGQCRGSLTGAEDFYRAEVVHAVLNEGALELDDVIDRRLRLRLHLDLVGPELVEEVASLMGDVLGWDVERTARAVSEFCDRSSAQSC